VRTADPWGDILRRSLIAALTVTAALGLSAGPAGAFDTGPHASITVDATMRAGFNRNAANAIQVENWLTDYYTSTPTIGSGAQCDLEKLHFDDVFSDADVANYWKTFTANARAAIQQTDRDGDVVAFYTALGISLHVVQDFYSHSNWVERHAQGDYATSSWFDQTPPSGVFTGWYKNCLNIPQGTHVPHGGYNWGMNHDSVVRVNYDRAYVFALAASYEWTQNALSWVSPAFALKVKNYAPSQQDLNDLAYDQKASIYVSEWIQNPLDKASLDGHWNGNRSGFAAAFAKFVAQWTAAHNSIYVATFKNKKIYAAMSQNLYTSTVGQPPAIIAYPTAGRIFMMRTLSVYANSAFTGTDSYFGTLAAADAGNGGNQYRDASQYHRPRTDVPWMQLVFVPSTQASLHLTYSLWNEWNTTNNDMVPIKGSQKTLTFSCLTSTGRATCSGDIAGGPWGPSNPYTTAGTGTSGVKVQMFFKSILAAP
jgi:hypothetical protein